MQTFRFIVLLGISAVLSFVLFLHQPRTDASTPIPPEQESPLGVSPQVVPNPPPSPPEPAAAPDPEKTPPVTEAPPPPESGTPQGEGDAQAAQEPDEPEPELPTKADQPEDPREPARQPNPDTTADEIKRELTKIQSSPELLGQAADEVRGVARHGFQTVFLCAGKDQLEIARFFGEALVLQPRVGLDPKNPLYYRLDLGPPARVETVREVLPHERFRQYRDLTAFPYDSLPAPLRDLRRRVFVRGDIYQFAALIPLTEWALVISRREAALRSYNDVHGTARTLDNVRRFTLRYVRLSGGAFDIQVSHIHFANGSTWTVPSER